MSCFLIVLSCFFCFSIRPPPISTRTATLVPDTTLFRSLIFHRRGRGAGAARIFEAVRHRVIGRADDIERRLKILFGFAGEADDEVARDRDIGAHGTHALDDAKIAVDRMAAVHRGEDAVAARLHRQVEEGRSEEHTSELQSLMRISYAVFCLKKKNTMTKHHSSATHI